MKGRLETVLLAGDFGIVAPMLQKWLCRQCCKCQFAATFQNACRRLSQTEFDLVLCKYHLPDRTAFPLLDWLEGTGSTLIFYASSGEDGRWLPMIERGKRCPDRPLLRTQDLPQAVAQIFEEGAMESSAEELKQIASSAGQAREVAAARGL
jgi:CheY-like chemotaxis protein